MKKVVIVGGGITGLAAAWELQQRGVDYVLLESSGRLGGKIITERIEGFVIEGAADSYITQKPWGWQLCHELGLADRLLPTNDHLRQTYVLRGGQLHPMPKGMRLIVPTDPDAIRQTTLLSEEGKARMLAESQVPPRSEGGDESLASFVRRRYGEEVLRVFGEPLLAGIYTGNPETLSMGASFPNYLKMEQAYGSLAAGIAQAPLATADPLAPSTIFVSLKSGMAELVEQLQSRLTGDIRLNETVREIGRDSLVRLESGETIEAEAIIMTLAGQLAAGLVEEWLPELSRGLTRIHTMSSATVSLGFRESELNRPLDGFGFVVASDEPTHLRASTWSSTKLAGRAPQGYALLRVFLGGYRAPEDMTRPDEELVALARRELSRVMGLEATPVISRVFRWHNASSQYEVGHQERVAHFKTLCPAWLQLAGSPYEGVGIPDCIRQGRQASRNLLTVAAAHR